MNREMNGASIAQYGIIITLIALAVVPLFFLFGQNIVKSFAFFSECLNNQPNSIASTTPPPTSTPVNTSAPETSQPPTRITPPGPYAISAAGSLGGTRTNPVRACTNGMCQVDYGTFILNGIPDNFSEFVETSGPAAGTDTILSTLDSIIQAADSGKINLTPETLEAVRNLAEKGHLLASGEREFIGVVETGNLGQMVNSAVSPTGQRTRLNVMYECLDIAEAEEYKKALAGFKNLSDTTVDPTIKQMVSTLGDNISTMYDDFSDRMGMAGLDPADPSTFQTAQDNFFASHHITNLTDLDSTVICGIGNGRDTGVNCK